MLVPILLLCLPLEIIYLAANHIKIPTGGWLSLLIGLCTAALMLLWTTGLHLLNRWGATQLSFAQFYNQIQDGSQEKLNETGVYINQKKFENLGEDDDIAPSLWSQWRENWMQYMRTNSSSTTNSIQLLKLMKKIDIPSQVMERDSIWYPSDMESTKSPSDWQIHQKAPRNSDERKSVLKTDMHYYQQKRHISFNQGSWFFVRYPVILFFALQQHKKRW